MCSALGNRDSSYNACSVRSPSLPRSSRWLAMIITGRFAIAHARCPSNARLPSSAQCRSSINRSSGCCAEGPRYHRCHRVKKQPSGLLRRDLLRARHPGNPRRQTRHEPEQFCPIRTDRIAKHVWT